MSSVSEQFKDRLPNAFTRLRLQLFFEKEMFDTAEEGKGMVSLTIEIGYKLNSSSETALVVLWRALALVHFGYLSCTVIKIRENNALTS